MTNITKLKNPKAFSDYSQRIDDIYEFLEDFNSKRKKNMLIVSSDMIANIEAN